VQVGPSRTELKLRV